MSWLISDQGDSIERGAMLVRMLTEDDLMEIEGDVCAALRFAGVEDDNVTDLFRACVKITGGEPQIGPMRRREGKWDGRRVSLRMDLYGTPRGRQVLGHELGHAWADRFMKREVSEAWCDAFGAMISAPRRHVRACISVAGHRVHALAQLLEVEQEAGLLRLAEVTGRPCALERRPGLVVARGEPFPWPPSFRDVAAAKALGLHPIKVGARVGMMAVRAA
jgi:hypothetical protein